MGQQVKFDGNSKVGAGDEHCQLIRVCSFLVPQPSNYHIKLTFTHFHIKTLSLQVSQQGTEYPYVLTNTMCGSFVFCEHAREL